MSIFDTAKQGVGERRVVFTWSGPATEEYAGNVWGERVKLSITHNKDRKRFEATVSRCQWSQGDGYVMERHAVFVDAFVTFHTAPCARYSAGRFSEFVAETKTKAEMYAAPAVVVDGSVKARELFRKAAELAVPVA
jgi:hypothetical protein